MKDNGAVLILLTIFTILALTPLSGLAIIFAIVYLVYERMKYKHEVSVLTFHWDKTKKEIRQYWWLILLPFVSVVGQIIVAHFTLPSFNEHVMERVAPMLQTSSVLVLIPQLLLLAFGEEIAFRGFAQGKLSQVIHPRIALVLVSFVFAIAHLSTGSAGIVMYDVGFIFVDSLLYGLLFLKTKNIYLTTIAHFLANVAGIYMFALL